MRLKTTPRRVADALLVVIKNACIVSYFYSHSIWALTSSIELMEHVPIEMSEISRAPVKPARIQRTGSTSSGILPALCW